MKRLVLGAVAGAALYVPVGGATAQTFYSGPGYGPHVESRYEDRFQDRDSARRYRYRDARDDDRRDYRRSDNGCQPNYTVQDGVCKPYTGR